MSFTTTSTVRKVSDHFEPEAPLTPQELRAMRGHLEQIDYAAFAANRDVIAKTVGHADLERCQHLAIATAHARGRWVAFAIAVSQAPEQTQEDITKLAALRQAFEELSGSYDALRRLVERGYIPLRAPK
jgi:hypothetical protein